MNENNRVKIKGLLMVGSFFVCLAIIFMPVFPGKMNGLCYMDNLFNMISKGSSYFISGAIEDSKNYAGRMIRVKIPGSDDQQTVEILSLIKTSGLNVSVEGDDIVINDDMSTILTSCLADADALFSNNGAVLADRYQVSGEKVLYLWWLSMRAVSKDLSKQKLFEEARVFDTVIKKSLEPAYNYHGIEAMDYKENMLLILASLAFYVFYTVWYGFGIMYLFEGIGLKIGH